MEQVHWCYGPIGSKETILKQRVTNRSETIGFRNSQEPNPQWATKTNYHIELYAIIRQHTITLLYVGHEEQKDPIVHIQTERTQPIHDRRPPITTTSCFN